MRSDVATTLGTRGENMRYAETVCGSEESTVCWKGGVKNDRESWESRGGERDLLQGQRSIKIKSKASLRQGEKGEKRDGK